MDDIGGHCPGKSDAHGAPFFELFFEDAIEAAELLGLALTSRDATEKDERIPMCGVPVRAVDQYVARVIKAGRTVTICDQMEDSREAKGIVKRAVVRTITPGTVLEPDLLDERANNYLGAVLVGAQGAGLAFLDVTTGEFLAAELNGKADTALADELTRNSPVEVLLPETHEEKAVEVWQQRFPRITFTRRPDQDFDMAAAGELLLETFELSTLKGIGLEDAQCATACAGALLRYVRETQRDAVPHLQFLRRYNPSGYVILDGNTQRNLELIESLADKSKRGTLLGVLDRTLTSMGGRKLRHWILHPLVDVDAIRARLNAVEDFFENSELRLALRELLKGFSDLERLLGRLTAKAGNARDVKALGRSLARIPEIRATLGAARAPLLQEVHAQLDELADVAGWIDAAIVDEPPLALNEGGLLKDGFNEKLDHFRGLVRGGRDWIATLQKEERERTGISNLKVGYNKVFGYYIEISKGNARSAPEDYHRKQTLVNAERYITPKLKEREEEILTAQEQMSTLEYELFVALRNRIAAEARRIQQSADLLATLDVFLALADVAVTKGYAKPEIQEAGDIQIREGRHPVVEDLMQRAEFVPNDTHLDPERTALQIVTGPNMAGKSTYLRQVALITLMAQMGSFVPAAGARIGVVDRIFTRVGASDNLVRGESTFMVEMIETANILNSATRQSLLVLDEIGRGTSTYDGISIAWSVAEYIHDHVRAKALFATHYHELTELANKLERAKNLNVAVREWGDKVIFLYRIVDGGADHSYGIQVAKLAGLPPALIRRAREILESLESGNTAALGLPQQMYLFGPQTAPALPSEVEKELQSVDPDTLSPRDAQEFLYHLKHLLSKPRKS
ncbi:MAG: DNA mismatch repair protein MutS [Candidatus Hydrogenedentes bacterium]|nr:DNA mismatch repair protein MutS [Candidatus Hydrogenedentota bacterium]